MKRFRAKYIATLVSVLSFASFSNGFGGEILLSSNWRDWHHNALTRTAAEQAGFLRIAKLVENPTEDAIDSAAAEIGWHASFLDSYAYNPLYWAMRGPKGYTTAVALHSELIKLHYDDTNSTPQLRQTIFRYTTGTLAGLLWAKQIYDGGEKLRGIAVARHILGCSLHATQDMYSHSNWIDAPDRRPTTWFEQFTKRPTQIVNTQLYTGAYEHPEQTSVHSHGIMSPGMSAMKAMGPILDILSSDVSPVHDMPTMETWRKYKNRTEAILPGIIDSNAFGTTQASQEEVSADLDQLTARPSPLSIGMPPDALFVAPPGMAIDASYLAKIACRERNIIDIPPHKAFITAYKCGLDGSRQWLQRLDQVMTDSYSQTSDFWTMVKTAPPTNLHHECFEDFNNLGFSFISAGVYPESATATQAILSNDANKIPATEYFLRVKLKTSIEVLSGTDADIYLEADGTQYLLDYCNVKDKGFADTIFAYNDFEGGMTTTYTVGPFSQIPSSVKLVNKAGDLGTIFEAIGNNFVAAINDIGVAIGDFFALITGAKPDYIGEKRKVWSAQQLVGISAAGHDEILNIDGGDEGRYDLTVHIQKLSTNGNNVTYRITPKKFKCVKESTIDQLDGRWGDEVFVTSAITPFPGNPRGDQTPVILEVHTGNEKLITNQSFDVTVPAGYGAISYAAMFMESDSDDAAARLAIKNKFVNNLDLPALKRTNLLAEVGRAVAADWKVENMEITAFSRGKNVGVATVFSGNINTWIAGNTSSPDFALNRSAMVQLYSDALHLQKLDVTNDPEQKRPVKDLPIIPTIIKDPTSPPKTDPPLPAEPIGRPKLGKILLVDDNRDDSNALDGVKRDETKADGIYRKMLDDEGLKYDIFIAQTYKDGPDLEKLSEYDTVVWYVGGGYNAELTGDDRSNVRAWVSRGNKNLYLFAPGFINELSRDSTAQSDKERWLKCDNLITTKLFGLIGCTGMMSRFLEGDIYDAETKDLYMVGKGSATETIFSPLNPAPSTKALVLYETKPYNAPEATKQMLPVATVARSGSSFCTYIGFTMENIVVDRQKLFKKLIYSRP